MSQTRQEPTVRCLALTVPPGHRVANHAHDWPQVVYAVRGVISVTTAAGGWVVPPMRALWIAAGVEHALAMRSRVEVRTLYIRPDVAPAMTSSCCVIDVPPLLRELIVFVVERGGLHSANDRDAALLRVLVDRLCVVPVRPLALPIPRDPRARRVAQAVLASPGRRVPLTALARGSGASARTVERAFLTEAGMPFGRWRQHARLHESIRLLGEGHAVTNVALQVGYNSPSAFVAAFRKCFGRTPSQYYRPSI